MAAAPNGAVAEPVQGQGQPQGGTATSTPAAPAPWYAEFKDADLKGYAELNKWASPEAAAKDAREAQKLIGVPKDELLRIPKDLNAAKPEELDALHTRLGRPASPTDYKIQAPENDVLAPMLLPAIHKAGLNQQQLDIIAPAYMEAANKIFADAQKAEELKSQTEVEQLHREWPGEIFGQRQEMARRGVSQFVMPIVGGDRAKAEEALGKMEDALGTSMFLKIWSGVGEKVGEGSFVGGDQPSSGFGMTPDAAHAALEAKKGDPEWRTKFLNNPKGPEAAEFDRLSRIASQRQQGPR